MVLQISIVWTDSSCLLKIPQYLTDYLSAISSNSSNDKIEDYNRKSLKALLETAKWIKLYKNQYLANQWPEDIIEELNKKKVEMIKKQQKDGWVSHN